MKHGASADKGHDQTNSGGIWRSASRCLRISRAMAIGLLLVASVTANATLFVGGVLYNIIDEALESVTGLQTATSKGRKATDALKRKNRLLVHRNRVMQDRMIELQRENGRLKGRMAGARRTTNAAVSRTVARSAHAAARVVATAPAKALPYIGTAVVVGAAAWEIKDLCDTIRDMKEIQREIDPSESHAEVERRVCGMEPPTQGEILLQIKTLPLHAWQRSREFLTDLDPVPPEFETWLKGWWNRNENILRDGLRWLRLEPD